MGTVDTKKHSVKAKTLLEAEMIIDNFPQGASSSVLLRIFPSQKGVNEFTSTMAVDIQAPIATPFQERIRIDINLFNGISLSSHLLDTLFGCLKPLLIGGM